MDWSVKFAVKPVDVEANAESADGQVTVTALQNWLEPHALVEVRQAIYVPGVV